jgi:hypothetical protein
MILLTACSGRTVEPTVVTTTEYIQQNIPIQGRPGKVNFPPVDWYVITEENLEEKIAEIEAQQGSVVVFAVTSKGYENLALGIAELRRYINEQKAIIVYYEDALNNK